MNHPEITKKVLPLLKQMQLTGRACKSPLTLATAVKKQKYPCMACFFFKFIASLQSKLMRKSNRTEHYTK